MTYDSVRWMHRESAFKFGYFRTRPIRFQKPFRSEGRGTDFKLVIRRKTKKGVLLKITHLFEKNKHF